MNEAIKLAIEKGGYTIEQLRKHIDHKAMVQPAYKYAEITQDPLFWQALGKALGWSNHEPGLSYSSWHEYALDYYNLVLTGGDQEKFWKELK